MKNTPVMIKTKRNSLFLQLNTLKNHSVLNYDDELRDRHHDEKNKILK